MAGMGKLMKRVAVLGMALGIHGFFFVGVALAAGGGADRSGDLLDLLYRFINFALLVIILYVVLKKAGVKNMFAARGEEIEKHLEALKKAKEEAEQEYRDLEQQIREFEKSKQGIMEQFRAEGLAEKQKIIAEAEARVAQILEQARATMVREVESAKDRLRQDLLGMAAQKAEEMLEKQMTDKDQDRLVDEFIERVGKAH
ncbi:MAG: ATP synthase F0 subunit B [Thermodesulfobacteriota bacterium]